VAANPIPPVPDVHGEQPRLPSEAVPELYRQILDLVAELERTGHRREAARRRSAAIAAYSRGWNEASRRRLEHMAASMTQRLAGPTVRDRLHLG